MEPRTPELEKLRQPRPEQKQKHFRIVKLEERIAPSGGPRAPSRNPHSGCATICFCRSIA